MEIEKEIKQSAFQDEFHKAFVNVIFTAGWLSFQHHKLLKPFDVSVQQFNLLRILRGQKGKPVTVFTLQERMLDKMSNASRLVEKLRKKGFVERTECEDDRRRVDVIISSKGLEALEQMDKVIDDFYSGFNSLTKSEATELSNLLDKLRG